MKNKIIKKQPFILIMILVLSAALTVLVSGTVMLLGTMRSDIDKRTEQIEKKFSALSIKIKKSNRLK
jgi:hypothetical protein